MQNYSPILDSPFGFRDAAQWGFSPDVTGVANQEALQRAVDHGGTIVVSRPGTYALAGTVYIGSHTSLIFGNGVSIKKVAERGPFSHVLLNKGAVSRTWDEHIIVHGLHVIVNDVDIRTFNDVFGLHGQLAFFYARDIRITGFRCQDLGKVQYGIHVCTFEDLVIDDVHIRGMKDGVHLGRGSRFTIRNGVFQTFDDAIALNAHDYDVGNPELGWIEDGIIENCHDLNQDDTTGYFCRILAGAWTDWRQGMEVQKSDTVASMGRLYRVRAEPDGTVFRSQTQPTHEHGAQVLDSIRWEVVQNDVTYTAGVRNVTFRDIFLHKPRIAFSIHFDNECYSRSYYPGSSVPLQQNLCFENVSVLYEKPTDFLAINTPVDEVKVSRCRFVTNRIAFYGNQAMSDYGRTQVTLDTCTFTHRGPDAFSLLDNQVSGKSIALTTRGSTVTHEGLRATLDGGEGQITVRSDLPGLR